MRIRNDRGVRLLVPSLHIETDPGDTERVPAGTEIPEGFTLVDEPKPSTKKKSTEPTAAAADDKQEETD